MVSKLSAKTLLAAGPVVPVLVIEEVEHALPIAEALLDGGIKVLEVTLRTPNALTIIERLRESLPEAWVGAGTVIDSDSLRKAADSGASFFVSPGVTPALLAAAREYEAPLLPGIATVSELMLGLDAGHMNFKFFPAEYSGGIAKLKAIAGPFPDVRFCPTGGINPNNATRYLELSNVMCVGGSWLVTPDIVAAKNWSEITKRCKAILARI